MAMTLRLTEDEQTALQERAESEGISMQEAARRAVRDYVARGNHRDRVSAAANRVIEAHAEALDRLGQGQRGRVPRCRRPPRPRPDPAGQAASDQGSGP